ncbi:hypothetical protein [Photobacterium kasasachensis]|uniref:hypothetical protein n=1 Tax=Photobacterium kasasachensis TaxID=2910240 RepID=UPI003D100291
MKIYQGILITLLFSLLYSSAASATHRNSSPSERLPVTQLHSGSNAIFFDQVNFDLVIGPISNSDWGQFRVKPTKLTDRRGKPLGTGYVNVFTYPQNRGGEAVWAISNLFVSSPADSNSNDRRKTVTIKHADNRQFTQPGRGSSATISRRQPNTPEPEMSAYFDLRPGKDGQGSLRRMRATVLFSPQPLPTIEDVAQFAKRFPPQTFSVSPIIINAEGAGHVDGRVSPISSTIPSSLSLGRPPQPVTPAPGLPDDLLFPIQVIQADQPNLDAGRNQCVPMAHANALQYLEDRYDNLPLAWRFPQLHIRGIGKVSSAGDVLIWEPVPENSLVANIDSYGRRAGVLDLDSGSYTTFCGLIRGVFGYLADPVSGAFDTTEFRHQGSGSITLGSGADCDNGTVIMNGITSQREGLNPTWEWMFNELVQGRAVTILFSWYDVDGDWTGGHSVRVYGAAKLDNRHYIYTLDDGSQGDNFSNLTSPRTQQWEVADTGQPGLDGVPDGRLNMNGMSWEIDFALSYEAKPTLLIP